MAEYIRPIFLNPQYPSDIFIKNKAKYTCFSYFLMDEYGVPSSSGKNITTMSVTNKHHKNNKRKKQICQSSNKRLRPVESQQECDSDDVNDMRRLIQLQDTLDYLQDEWATIDIVLQSLRTAFTIHPSKMDTEDYLHNIDQELSITYDYLMGQIRTLDRSVKKLQNQVLDFGMNLV